MSWRIGSARLLKRSPLEWHGNAKRIAPDGKLKDKASVANHPSWMVKPLEPVYFRMESPSSGGVGADEGNTYANGLCPWNWFKKK